MKRRRPDEVKLLSKEKSSGPATKVLAGEAADQRSKKRRKATAKATLPEQNAAAARTDEHARGVGEATARKKGRTTANERRRARKRSLRQHQPAAREPPEAKADEAELTPSVPMTSPEAVPAQQAARRPASLWGEEAQAPPARDKARPTKSKAKAATEAGLKQQSRQAERSIVAASKGNAYSQPSQPQPIDNSNWAALKAIIGGRKREAAARKGSLPAAAVESGRRPLPLGSGAAPTRVVAVDCEMVGVGPDGVRSSLARVCVVNDQGNVLMDKFVRQKEAVTDYRTRFSGVRPQDVRGEAAATLEAVQEEAAQLFKDRIVVGHALQNDLKALLLSHPRRMTRDTARFPPLMREVGPTRRLRPRALRHLAFELLGLAIQEGEHSPVDDARAALYLYQRHSKEWERSLRDGSLKKLRPNQLATGIKGPSVETLEALAARDVMVDL